MRPLRYSVRLGLFAVLAFCLVPGSKGASSTWTYKVIATVKVGRNPMGVGRSGSYVANWGGSTISLIDQKAMKESSQVAVGNGPYAIAQAYWYDNTPVSRVFITNQRDNTVSVYDETVQKVIATVPVGKTPHGIAATTTAGRAYVANALDNSVSVINQRTLKVVATIKTGIGNFPTAVAARFDPSARTTFVFVTNTGSNTVSVIDTNRDEVVKVISSTSSLPINYPIGAAAIPTFARCFVTNQRGGFVSEIDTSLHKTLARLPVGRDPVGIGIKHPAPGATSSSRYDLFVANETDNTVTILKRDGGVTLETQVLSVGRGPIGVDASGGNVAITNRGDSTVTYITAAN